MNVRSKYDPEDEPENKPSRRYFWLGYYNPKQMMGGGVWALRVFENFFDKLHRRKKTQDNSEEEK